MGRFQTTMATAKGIKMSDIVIEFSGTIVADPYKSKFLKVNDLYSEDSGKQDTRPEEINGKQWLELDESEREDYILQCPLYFRPSGGTLKVWQELLEEEN